MKLYSIITIIVFMLISCQNTKNINITKSKNEIFTERKFDITTKIFKNSKLVSSKPEDFKYKCSRGKIVGTTYIAPKTTGNDVIEILHTPTKTKQKLQIEVIAPPKLVFEKKWEVLSCKEQIKIIPMVRFKGKLEKISEKDCTFLASKGRFEGNTYFAPDKDCADTIRIKYPKKNIEASLTFTVKSKPIFIATANKTKTFPGEEITITGYLKQGNKKHPVSSNELVISSKRGKTSGNVYISPEVSGEDTIKVLHNKTKQMAEISISIRKNISLTLSYSKTNLVSYEEMAIEAEVKQGNSKLQIQDSDIEFKATRGKFEKNTYKAPVKGGKDTITITYKPQNLVKTFDVKITFSKYRPMTMERFSINVPSDWYIETSNIGFIARKSKLRARQQGGRAEIHAGAIPGLDFLDIQTIKLFFQQHKGDKEMEESNEEEIMLAGAKATKIVFENFSGKGKKGWWILTKQHGAAYILRFSGPPKLFDSGMFQKVLDSFKFIKVKMIQEKTLTMPTKQKDIKHNLFNMKLPETWSVKTIGSNLLIGTSRANYKGKSATVFIMGYQQGEVQNLDLSLILVLFRQETVKDPTMKVMQEKEFKLKHGTAKMLEFEGGKNIKQKMIIVATKYNITAYGILFLAPVKLWKKNPKFYRGILNSFVPH